jgi:phage terminase small subunit
MSPLTPKQAAFVAEYLVDLNATQAAIRAGYSAKTAEVIGHQNLRKPQIAEALEQAIAARAAEVKVSAHEVLDELLVLMRSDVRHFEVDHDGRLTLAPGAPDRAWRAVSSVKHKVRSYTDDNGNTETTREIEFRLWDKNSAIDKVAKHIRFYPPEKIEVTGEDGGPVMVAGVDVENLSVQELAALAAKLASGK